MPRLREVLRWRHPARFGNVAAIVLASSEALARFTSHGALMPRREHTLMQRPFHSPPAEMLGKTDLRLVIAMSTVADAASAFRSPCTFVPSARPSS